MACQGLFDSTPVLFFEGDGFCPGRPDRPLVFLRPRQVIQACDPATCRAALREIDQAAQSFWLAGYITYEAAAWIADPRHVPVRPSQVPRLWFGVYDGPSLTESLAEPEPYCPWIRRDPALALPDYRDVIDAIKRDIRAGETYQVNFTFDWRIEAGCSAENLYRILSQAQPAGFRAYLHMADRTILSFSPELLFDRAGPDIVVRPMKGTAPRGSSPTEDHDVRECLRRDPKNLSENIMIVDLLRNDLGRICQPGSVEVPSLFDIETHPTLHQMTSTIRGVLRSEISYEDIFSSLCPSGSVTGAPKFRSMETIRQLEDGERGVYCGAIGYIAPGDRAVFSVPIRTLEQTDPGPMWRCRAGSGIVWDSGVGEEWREVANKTDFITAAGLPPFELVETMVCVRGQVPDREGHWRRIAASADFFGFRINKDDWNRQIDTFLAPSDHGSIIRLVLSREGIIRGEAYPRNVLPEPVSIRLAPEMLDRNNIFLQHKTTYRPWYKDATARLPEGGVFDEIFFNSFGELCEGTRTNIFVQLQGKLYTPPHECGLLPGILRARLLAEGRCRARVLTRPDLDQAEAIFCGNSVRGLMRASFIDPTPAAL